MTLLCDADDSDQGKTARSLWRSLSRQLVTLVYSRNWPETSHLFQKTCSTSRVPCSVSWTLQVAGGSRLAQVINIWRVSLSLCVSLFNFVTAEAIRESWNNRGTLTSSLETRNLITCLVENFQTISWLLWSLEGWSPGFTNGQVAAIFTKQEGQNRSDNLKHTFWSPGLLKTLTEEERSGNSSGSSMWSKSRRRMTSRPFYKLRSSSFYSERPTATRTRRTASSLRTCLTTTTSLWRWGLRVRQTILSTCSLRNLLSAGLGGFLIARIRSQVRQSVLLCHWKDRGKRLTKSLFLSLSVSLSLCTKEYA